MKFYKTTKGTSNITTVDIFDKTNFSIAHHTFFAMILVSLNVPYTFYEFSRF